MIEHLHRLYRHLFWADREMLSLLRRTPEPDARRLAAHLLTAERVWLARLRGEAGATPALWPDLQLDECEALAAEAHGGYRALLDGLTEPALGERIRYRNSRGLEFHTERGDVLLHVAMHGSYHRGQLMQRIRQAGAEPVNTDYISWVRRQR